MVNSPGTRGPSIPYADQNPMRVLRNIVGVQEPSPSIRRYYLLQFLMFASPSVCIWLIASRSLHRDLAVAISSAFLSVQLVGPWERWRKGVVGFLQKARENSESVWQHAQGYISLLTDSQGMLIRTDHITTDSGMVLMAPSYPRPLVWPAALRMQLFLNGAWSRYFFELDRVIIEGVPIDPSADLVACYPQTWILRHSSVLRAWYAWRGSRTLRKIGRLLLKFEYWRENADAPARRLAEHAGLCYRSPHQRSLLLSRKR